MAGDWIKMRNNLWDDPRVSRLCDLTEESEASVIGGLYWLWSSADEHTEDGRMPGLSLSGIDRKTGVKGLGAALVEIGWVDNTEGGVTIIRFDEHNGTSAKRRCMEAQRKANSRNASASHADNTQTEEGDHAELEKRREDIKTTTDVVVAEDGFDGSSPTNKNQVLISNRDGETELQAACRVVWESYSHAYTQRYGAKPVRNAKVNGQVRQFVGRIGREEGPAVAAFFVGHNSAFYVKKMHGVGVLLADAEKLRTEWATGNRVTDTKARQSDRAQTTGDTVAEILAERAQA